MRREGRIFNMQAANSKSIMPSLTFLGGVNEIGGNKILLEDRGTRIFLDFGMSFSKRSLYYEEYLSPRSTNGLGDFLEMGLIPNMEGLYREDLLRLIGKQTMEPTIDGVFLSHAHADHANYISFLHEDITIYCGETAYLILQGIQESSNRDIESEIIDFKRRPIIDRKDAAIKRPFNTFRTGKIIKIGSLEIEPVHVDHSIPGAYGFIIHTSKGAIIYTGDFRMHGLHPEMTEDFVEKVREIEPIAMICEGTNVDMEKDESSEARVRKECGEIISRTNKIAFVDFNFKDVDRLQTFLSIAGESNRKLVLTPKNACILKWFFEDKYLKKVLPRIDDDMIVIYKPKKGTGRYDEKDYDIWEREYFKYRNVWTASEIREEQNNVMMTLGFYGMNELIDIKPELGSIYLHSLSEPFNEEMWIDYDRLKNWLEHFKLEMYQSHASGHASRFNIKQFIEDVNPRTVFPIHTEHPELFMGIIRDPIIPVQGKKYEI